MATKGKKVEIYYTSKGTTTGIDASALIFDGKNLEIHTHGKVFKGTDTTYSANSASGLSLSGTQFSLNVGTKDSTNASSAATFTSGRFYQVVPDKNNKLGVVVPWQNSTYTVNNGTYSIKSLIGSTTTPLSDFTANQSDADDFTLVQGPNITFTNDAANRKLTIAGTADTKVTSVNNHYTPSANADSSLNSTVSSTDNYSFNTEYSVVKSINVQRDAKGHVTGITTTNQKVKDTNTNTAQLQISDTTNRKINTSESTGKYIQFTGDTNKITVTDGTNSFDVSVTPFISNNVTGSGLTAGKIVLGDGSSTVKTSSKGIVTTLGNDDTTVPTSKAVQSAISNATAGLTGAMHFIGTSTTAITDGGTENPTISGYSGTAKTAGNVLLYNGKEYIWTGSAWELFGDEGSYALKTIKVEGDGVLGGGGTLESNRKITHNTSGVDASTYGPNDNVTGSEGATIKVPQITVDSYGHVTAVTERTYTSKNSTYTVNNGTYSIKSKVGDTTTIVSDFTANQSSADDFTIIQGSNITLTPDAKNRTLTIAGKAGTVTKVSTGIGLTGGDITTTGTIKAKLKDETKNSADSTKSTSTNGGLYSVEADKSGNLAVRVPWTDTKVTSVDNHYTPSANNDSSLTANASGASAAWSIDVVKGVNIQRDAKGHVTGLSVTSGKIPANPNNHYTAVPVLGATSATSNATSDTTNDATFLNIVENNTKSGGIKIQGSGTTSVSAKNGILTISSADSKTGTVTKVSTGIGLTGGDVTTTGTIKAKLKNETLNTADSTKSTSTNGGLYSVEADKSGNLAVRVPWTDTNTKVTSVDNHYAPSANNDSSLNSTVSSTGNYALGTEYSVVTGINIQRDAKGHVTGVTTTNQKVKDTNTWQLGSSSQVGYVPKATAGKYLHSNATTGALEWVDDRYAANTDRYVNSAVFADDTTNNASSPVKMTLTRAGSDTATVTANLPKVSSSSAGVAPKGAAVSSQSQSTKFLREDGSWAAPSYTTNTDKTAIKKGTAGATATANNTLISANSSSGIIFEGGTNLFKVGNGTNSITIGVEHGLVTKNMSINGTNYALYTSATSLPTIIAPTAYAGTGGQVLATNSSKNGLTWTSLPTKASWNYDDVYTKKTQAIPVIIGPSTDTTKGTWTGTTDAFSAYADGLTIIYVPAVAGASTTTLNINGLGAKTCHFTDTSNLTTHFAVGTPIMFTYYGGYWKRADYDSNSNTQYYLTLNGKVNGHSGKTNLGTIWAPSALAGTGGYILATNSNKTGLEWVAKPTSNVTTSAIVGNSSSATTQISANQTNPFYNLIEGSSVTRSIQFKGDGTTSVTSDANGVITISSSDSKTGTVTSVATGIGLTGGTITGSGTIKAKLKDETKNSADSTKSTSTNGGLYAVEADKSGNLAVRVPWTYTDTKVTSVDNHYAPSANNDSSLNSTASSTDNYAINTEYSVVKAINVQRDAKGHVTGITTTNQKIKDTNTTYSASTATGISLSGTAFSLNVGTKDSTNASSAAGFTSGRFYQVVPDKNNKLGVVVPWQNSTYTVNNGTYSIKSKVGDTTTTVSDFTANQSDADDFTLVQGTNITFTNDAANRTLTIAGTPNTWRPVGTGANDAAAGNHTHAISIAADSGTNQLSLNANTKYKLTAGGQSYIFTTPKDNNTWKAANTSQEGYIPKLATGGGTIATPSTEYVLTFKSGTDTAPVWRLLPANAYNDHTYTIPTVYNATYSIKSLVGSTSTTLSDFTANQSGNDDFTLVQGTNITFTNDAKNRKLTIAGTADTKVTAVGNHYDPVADASTELTASLSGTAGAYAINTEYTVLTGVKAQRDAKGHVTGLTYTAQKVKDTNSTYNFSGSAFYSGNSGSTEKNANNVASNAITYYTSNGPTTTQGATTNDGALYVQAYSTSWVGQIAQDYRNGRLFVRGKNNGTWTSWLNVLDSGNSSVSLSGSTLTVKINGTSQSLTNTNTWNAVSSTVDGYVPKIGTAAASTIGTQADEWVLTSTKGGTPSWRALPANAFKNNTYTVNNGTFTVKGAGTAVSSTSANTASNSSVDIIAGSNVTVTPDATNKTIQISATDTDTWRPVQGNGTSIGDNTLNIKPGTGISVSVSGGNITITNSAPDQDHNTDTKATQSDSNTNQESPVLVKNGTGTGTVTSGVIFADGVTINPSTNSLSVSGNLSVTGTASFGNNVTVEHPLVINSTVNNSYNEGLRITRAANKWAGITFGSTGFSGAPTGGWFVATNPAGQFIINPDDSGNTSGICCNKGGKLMWRNQEVIHSGNISSQTVANATSAGNASTLGGTSKDGLFTDLSRPSSTNNLSITIGGTTKTITLGARAFDDTNCFKCFGFNAGKTYIGWVSIASLQLNTSNHYDYNSFNLYICRNYSSPSSESYAINITIGWAKATIRLIGKSVGTQIISKCRIAIDTTNHVLYLQVYVKTQYTAYQNSCSATLVGIVDNNWTVVNAVNDSLTNVAELDLTAGIQADYATSAGSVAWANVSSKPETATRWPAWSEVTGKPSTFTPSSHDHDGRYIRWSNSTADTGAMTWGTLTSSNGYNILSHCSSSDGGDMGWCYKGGQIFYQVNGFFYQNEGKYRVLDTSDAGNLSVNYATSAGSVAWTNVSDKPDTATRWPSWSEVTNKPDVITTSNISSQNVSYANSAGTANGLWFSNDGTLKLYSVSGGGCPSCGTETVCLQSCFDGADGSSHSYVNDYTNRCVIALQPRGGYVGINTTTPSAPLHVNGTCRATTFDGNISWSNVTDKPAASGNATTPVYWNGSGFTNCTAYASASVNYANSAGSVTWTNVSNKPAASGNATTPVYWNGSGFTNCTAYASASVNYASSAGSVAWSNVSDKPFDSNGNLHISHASSNNMSYNTTNPMVKFSNSGSQAMGLVYTDYDSYRASKGIKCMDVDNSDTGNCWFEVQGSLYIGSQAYANSDRHLKKDISSISSSSLEALFNISDKLLKQFTWKQSGKASYGLIAQELEQYIPEAVEYVSKDTKTVNYQAAFSKIIAALVHKVKEQANIIEEIRSMLSSIS